MKYVVVENAGYDGEREIKTFSNLIRADDFVRHWYEPDEIETLHVLIRKDWVEENGVERREFV
jgi:hypothetical protein